MRTWRTIGKICLKYCLFNIILIALMLATTILPPMQQAMADTPAELIEKFSDITANTSMQDINSSQLPDIDMDSEIDNNNISDTSDYGMGDISYDNFQAFRDSLRNISNSTNTGEDSGSVINQASQANQRASNSISEPENAPKVTALVTPGQDVDIELNSTNRNLILRVPNGAVDQELEIEIIDHGSSGSKDAGMLSIFEMNAVATDRGDSGFVNHESIIGSGVDHSNNIGIANDGVISNGQGNNGTESTGEANRFNKGLTLTVQHSPEELAGLNPYTLKLYYLDEDTLQWIPVQNSAFDPETYTLTATIDHFSFYGEMAEPTIVGPGRVMAFQADLHSGAATYSYPIEVPDGVGGLQPNINLIYNSASVDEMKNKRDVGSWVGIGWSLSMGYVSYDLETEEYYLCFDGMSHYELIKDGNGNYSTMPESFYSITRSSKPGLEKDVWVVHDREGIKYEFGGTNDSQQFHQANWFDYSAGEHYRYDLSSISDLNGNVVNISYKQDIWCWTYYATVRSAYPEHIQYNDGLIDIYFNSSYDIQDEGYGNLRTDNPKGTFVIENARLNYIDVKADGDLVRKYGFTYNTTPAYETSDYGSIEYSGWHTLTSIAEFGSDGVSSLPATTFEYTDLQVYCYDSTDLTYKGNPGNPAVLTWPYLASSINGYGATVNFTYSEKPTAPSWTEATVGEKIDIDDASMLFAAWYSPDGDVFVSELDYGPTGYHTNILHYDGFYWAEMETNNSNTIWDIWGFNSSNVFAVGENGTILYYDGSNWTQMNSHTSESLMGIGGNSSSDVYAVGDSGTILHYNGIAWSAMDSGTSNLLYDIWDDSASNVYAVGESGTILQYNGSEWRSVESNSSDDLAGVWGTSYSNIYAAGESGTVLHYDGLDWRTVDIGASGTSLFRIWGTSSADIFISSLSENVFHYNGPAWSSTDTGTTNSWVLGICGDSSGEVYAVGIESGEGFVVEYKDSSWDQVSNTPLALSAICVLSDDDIFAGTIDGHILHYDGYYWSETYSTNSKTIWSFWDLTWNQTCFDGFAVGDGGTILHYDGSTWTSMSSGTTKELYDVCGIYFPDYQALHAFAVGADGTFLHYDGSTWAPISSGVTEDLYGVYAELSGVYIAGTEGTILRYHSGISQKNSNTSCDLYGVWGFSPGELFAVGEQGTVINSSDDGDTWPPMDSGTEEAMFFRVWGTSELNVFAVGIPDAIYHYDGVNWDSMDSGTTGAWLLGVDSNSSDDVYIAGVGSEGGILLKYPYNNMWTRQIVSEMTMDPGIGEEQTYEYTYAGDPEYFKVGPGEHPWDDEYRGFPQVRVTDAEGNYTEHYFWTTGSGKAEILTGREYRTEWYDNSSQLLKTEDYTWSYSFNVSEPTDPFSGLAGYWSFNESSGQTVNDSSGNGNNGTLGRMASPSWTDGGRFDNALAFNGDYDYVMLPNSSSLNLAYNFSIEAWVKRDSLNTKDCIIASGTGESSEMGHHQWLLYLDDSDNDNRICFEMGEYRNDLPSDFFYLYGDDDNGACINDSVWHHVAVTFNRTGSIPFYRYQCCIYVDGIKKTWKTRDILYYYSPITTGIIDVRIGSRATGADYFHGTIDDVCVYNRTLSAEEIEIEANMLSAPFVYLEETTVTQGDKTSRTRYVYDEYGNLVTEYVDGDLDTTNDDRTIHRVYYPNTSVNILSKPARERVYSSISDDIVGANLSSETLYYYDGNNTNYNTSPSKGNPTRIESKVNANSSVSIYYTYDTYGNVLTEQDANGNTWQSTYDTTYHIYPVNISSPMAGQYETYDFDPGTGNLLSRIDVNDQATSYEYDVFGRITKVIRPGDTNESPSAEYQYNNWGNLSQQHLKTLAKVNTSDYLWSSQYFDGFGRVIQAQSGGESGYTIIDSTTTYDSRGLADKVYVPQALNSSQVNGYVTPESSWKYSSSTYDALGRVVVTTAADNTSTSMDYSAPWQTTVTNPNEYKHTYYYDAFNQLIQVDEMDDSDELYASTMYDYDTVGNLVQVEDEFSNITTMTYDWIGRKTNMSDPDMGDWSYQYDNNGNLISQTDAKEQTITLTYDEMNRITAKLYPAGSGMANVSYTYDDTSGGNYGVGRLTAIEDDMFSPTTYKYDERGRLTTECRFSYFYTYYEYDSGDRLTSVTYPTDEVVTQTYNGRGLPDTLSGSVAGDLVTGTAYNELGQITRIDYGNGDYDTYAYNGLDAGAPSEYWGRLWRIQSYNSSDTLQDIRYTWDANGNMLTRQDYLASETETFTYDFLDRLTSVSGAYSASYSYNEIGNIMSMNGVNYTYGGSQPHAVTSVGNTSYAYDDNGNMITRGDQTITWDMANMPVMVTDGVDTSQFIYDGNGVRALKYDGGETVMYVNQYYELNWTSEEFTSHYYLGGREVAYKVEDDLRFVHQDHLSSTSLTTSAAGAVVATVKYFPFGVCRNSQGNLDTDKLFTGQRLDDTGLYYYNARYYDATIGRFISADTIVPNPANPQTLNRYSYCLNNPLKYTDPSGHLNPEDYPASEGWEPVYDNGGDVWGYTRGDMNVAIWAYTHPSVFYGGMGGFDRDYFYASLTGPQESYMDVFHVILDGLGLIPGFGEPADGFNGVLYAIEGDWTNAGISTAAMIPLLGWGATGGKWIYKGVKWGRATTLADHFTRHGAAFGARNADEYVNMASDFLRRAQTEKLPTKVDSNGIIRVYEPSTNTFGVYNSDGSIASFYKPDPSIHGLTTNMEYWNSQPGVSPW